jgi:zinc resistance-associated protein
MKRMITVLGIVLLVGAIALPAMAYGPGCGKGRQMMGYGQGGPGACQQYNENMTEEQRAQLDKLHQKFYDETAQLRSGLWAKRGELDSRLGVSNPDAEKIRALQKEISDMRAKMDQARIDFQLEARKINPDARYGMGYGKGGFGPHHRGYGRGMGNGPGGCWN